MKKQLQRRRPNSCQSGSPVQIESLENRQFLSATTTGLYISDRSTEIGQSFTIKATVSSPGGTPIGGLVELLSDNKDTGLVGTINHLGYTVFSFSPSQAVYVGTHQYRIRFLTDGSYVGSISRNLSAKVGAPALTTESDGLALGTVTTGSGSAAKAGQTVTVEYTGFNQATGAIFDDSTKDGSNFSFILDDTPEEQVIAGFDQEVTGMKVGETRVAVIPEQLGYATGTSSSLAGDTLVFVVQVVSIS